MLIQCSIIMNLPGMQWRFWLENTELYIFPCWSPQCFSKSWGTVEDQLLMYDKEVSFMFIHRSNDQSASFSEQLSMTGREIFIFVEFRRRNDVISWVKKTGKRFWWWNPTTNAFSMSISPGIYVHLASYTSYNMNRWVLVNNIDKAFNMINV